MSEQSDPAVEAAQRAWENGPDEVAKILYKPGQDGLWTPVAMEAAARETLNPLRELHRPIRRTESFSICATCNGPSGRAQLWPCATARLVYPESELS